MSADDTAAFIRAARAFVDAVTFDDSGVNSRGGNGGLLSRETIRRKDEFEKALISVERQLGSE